MPVLWCGCKSHSTCWLLGSLSVLLQSRDGVRLSDFSEADVRQRKDVWIASNDANVRLWTTSVGHHATQPRPYFHSPFLLQNHYHHIPFILLLLPLLVSVFLSKRQLYGSILLYFHSALAHFFTISALEFVQQIIQMHSYSRHCVITAGTYTRRLAAEVRWRET